MPISDRKQSTRFTRGIRLCSAVKRLENTVLLHYALLWDPGQKSLICGPGDRPSQYFHGLDLIYILQHLWALCVGWNCICIWSLFMKCECANDGFVNRVCKFNHNEWTVHFPMSAPQREASEVKSWVINTNMAVNVSNSSPLMLI